MGHTSHAIFLGVPGGGVSDRVTTLKDPKLRMALYLHLDNGLTELITHTDIFIHG